MHQSGLLLLLTLVPGRTATAQHATLRIDPRLIAEAAEVWSILGTDENRVWPGWDARDTPLYFYFPNVQEVLIGHPAPPAGFVRYVGPVSFPGREICLHDGPTIVDFDGQNTTREIGGVRVLVVADTLSNQRRDLEYLMRSARPVEARIEELDHGFLAADPYEQMLLVAHEAFHAFQARWGEGKSANELLLLRYPTLAVENNVGMALEGEALKEALLAADLETLEPAVLRWLAIRAHRRAALPPEAVAYEDGTEFNEGLAKYVEWRASEVLEGRAPGPGMEWVSGFAGYADLGFVRARLIEDMRVALAGERVVNDDPYGVAPVRYRLYYSGMAIGVLLDRLDPEWKARIAEPETTLTGLVEDALSPDDALLEELWTAALADPRRAELVAAKTRLAEEGARAAARKLDSILAAANGVVRVNYRALGAGPVNWSFSPFGITVIDAQRTIYEAVPISASFADGSSLRQTHAVPLLHDAGEMVLCSPLRESVTEEALAAALEAGSDRRADDWPRSVELDLPGFEVRATNSRVRWEEGRVVVELLPAR